MDFTFDEQQLAFREAIHRFLAVEAGTEALRELWDGDNDRADRLYERLAGQGLTALSVPEACGGLEQGDLDWVLVQQELGHFAIPDGLTDTAYLAVDLLSRIEDEALRGQWLPRIAEGSARVAVGHPLNPFVAEADRADLLLLWHEDEVHALLPGQLKLSLNRSIDLSRRLYRAHWTPTAETCVCGAEPGAALWAGVRERGALASAAQLLGLSARMLSLGTEYAAQRKQFGKAIGSFQAVKHQLADVAVRNEFAEPALHRAAYALAHGQPDAPVCVSQAKLLAGEAARLAASRGIQVHGAMGYTWEADLQMFMKRAWALDAVYGDRVFHKRRVREFVLAEAAPLQPGATFGLLQAG